MGETTTIARVGGVHAGYKFEFRQDGVFLTVYAQTDSGIMFELSDMRQILADYGVDDYDLELLAHTVREASGLPKHLSDKFVLPKDWDQKEESVIPSEGAEPEDGQISYAQIQIDISTDRMTATIRFEGTSQQHIPTKEMISEALTARHITYGIDMNAVAEAALSGRPTEIATGDKPVNGVDAVIVRKFDVGEKGRPLVDNNDRADYKNLNIFIPATKGQILAERIPHTKGVAGTNIMGDKVSAKNGKPKPVPVGKNTEIKDENYLVASLDGQIVDTGSKISVDPFLEIKGDIGMATGNINFDGAVKVNGSVQAGFVVEATGDIEINGMVSGAQVRGRNIYVKGGVQGMNRGSIVAREDFRATYVENADIEAAGDVYIMDVAMHSTVRAGHHLVLEEGKGQITGGDLAAGEEIRAKRIGNEANVSTRITVGVNPMLQKEYKKVLEEYNESRKRLDQLKKTINTLSKLDTNQLPPEKVERLNAVVRSQFLLAGQVERSEKKLKEIDQELQKMRSGRVSVQDKIYPGVKLTIDTIRKNIQSVETHCTQYVKDDFIVIGPY